ncbi:Nitrile hydratase, alpha chain subfamily [Synechococcus sp. PCC 7335]|uniref:nitrile hydratase subunit alpha n=1 Tax=Synechococcus sp. (strain ATCC 29403 / PCC 7335) TaxID=91464 RepID=UPI00017EB4E6|nr:nitrile hydratase subunit alpha [Synechococcus sp. PCC 7335]EDX85449.1 Nitrile hydratase, alpha chain subfamily [Synechococcus sp. PCC 7335]
MTNLHEHNQASPSDSEDLGTHDHSHDPIDDNEAYWAQKTQTIQKLLEQKGFFTAAEVRREIERQDSVTPMLGARLVARAWVDPDFKQRLLADGKAACQEMNIDTVEIKRLQVVENTPQVHHVVVCTLCSCYPRAILGYHPPSWYKSTAYRNRVVVDPRGVLEEEFGTIIPKTVEVRVMDSTADTRYLVIPLRPQGTESWSETDLISLINRDSMIGVSFTKSPEQLTSKP